MPDILLINPNTSQATTDMMVAIASAHLPSGFRITGMTAMSGPSMIVNPAELSAAGQQVEQVWKNAGSHWAGVIISAFGDPGIERVRTSSQVPVVGICEASMREAGANGRRFGIATVTPDLLTAIHADAKALGLSAQYTGARLTPGDPRALAGDALALEAALHSAVLACIEDGAQAVIIGGGPLGRAAVGLAPHFDIPIIAPIAAAVSQLLKQLQSDNRQDTALLADA
ncbi:aspartate/glutamate racemase family protein [Pigmentiphaga aceris]|uniref:Aspartate/glutamate racemase family protein n=1 Tax=Pigmentiphaga aceris TaxID=1940612 RepID=A0A5C0AW57_9BURK|nr:aspartate/glutamate racemase family protein [Pigmentiphaga aceris]QEI05110.1 aspartate/glutamate racemase family protein [Pigmentiphaga aceris]